MDKKQGNGYEYEVVRLCPRTGRPVVAPRAWSNKKHDRPWYPTCTCCKTR